LLILSIIGGAVLLLAATVIIVVLGLKGIKGPSDLTPTATEGIELTPTVPLSPLPTAVCETIISSGDIEVSIAPPISLTVKDTTFPAEPIVPEDEAWNYPADRPGTAVWVCGTVINYVIGLEPTPENETMVTGLTPGDEIRLQLSNGAVLLFRFAGRGEVPAGDEEALAQNQPRLTLILSEGDTWQTATADYVAEAESMEPPPPEASAQPSQPVQVGDARVTVNRGYVRRTDDVPPGTMYYLVEFSVDNEGASPLAIDRFSMKLEDSMGNTYLLSPPASEAGDFGPLRGEVAPGNSAQGSAGYLVPDPLPSGPLIWTFSPRAGSEAQASVSIPYEGGAGDEPSVTQADVAVNDAFFSSDGNTLILEGEIRNTGTAPLTIEEEDISLSSSAGLSELIVAAPLLPWTIEPDETQVIELQYQRPDASTVLLELVGYSFEINGLQ
jgi:hypothetical protein